jgi:hypothetical protein
MNDIGYQFVITLIVETVDYFGYYCVCYCRKGEMHEVLLLLCLGVTATSDP